jgi:hypothetical protein
MHNEEENPAVLEDIASWVLKKLVEDDYHFSSAGQEGRWELAIWQWEEDFGQPLKQEEVRLRASKVLHPELLSKLGEAGLLAGAVVLRAMLGHASLRSHLKDIRLQLGSKDQAAAESYLYNLDPS